MYENVRRLHTDAWRSLTNGGLYEVRLLKLEIFASFLLVCNCYFVKKCMQKVNQHFLIQNRSLFIIKSIWLAFYPNTFHPNCNQFLTSFDLTMNVNNSTNVFLYEEWLLYFILTLCISGLIRQHKLEIKGKGIFIKISSKTRWKSETLVILV